MNSIRRNRAYGSRTTSGFRRTANSPRAARKPWFTAGAKPTFREFWMTSSVGYVAVSWHWLPSVDALSTTIT